MNTTIEEAARKDYEAAKRYCVRQQENDEYCAYYTSIRNRRCNDCPLYWFASIEDALKGARD